jgi:hypothetical protein
MDHLTIYSYYNNYNKSSLPTGAKHWEEKSFNAYIKYDFHENRYLVKQLIQWCQLHKCLVNSKLLLES